MRRSQVQEEEIKTFLLRHLSSIEYKLGTYHSELKRLKWTFQQVSQENEQQCKDVEVPSDRLQEAFHIYVSLIDRFKELSIHQEKLQEQLSKYKGYQSFQDKQVHSLKQENEGYIRSLQMYAEHIKDLGETINHNHFETEQLKRINLNLQENVKQYQKNADSIQPQEEPFTSRCDGSSYPGMQEYIGAAMLSLKKVLKSNYSLIERYEQKINESQDEIKLAIQKLDLIKKDLKNIQYHERGDVMWNIWRKNEHEELMEKVDSMAHQVNQVEDELKNYKGLMEECNETLNKYEENYQELKASLDNLESCFNKTTEETTSNENLKKELQLLRESEKSYKDQINNLHSKLEKQKGVEQKYKRRINELNRQGQQTKSKSAQTPTIDQNSNSDVEKRTIDFYQEFPVTRSSKPTEFDPFKYNKNMKRKGD